MRTGKQPRAILSSSVILINRSFARIGTAGAVGMMISS